MKAADAGTFGRVLIKVFPNISKIKRRTEKRIPLSAILVHMTKVFHLGRIFTLNYSPPEWLKSSAIASRAELFLSSLGCYLMKTKNKVITWWFLILNHTQSVKPYHSWYMIHVSLLKHVAELSNLQNLFAQLSVPS